MSEVGTRVVLCTPLAGSSLTPQARAHMHAGGVNASRGDGKGAFAAIKAASFAAGGPPPEGWYQRWENNGWRPVRYGQRCRALVPHCKQTPPSHLPALALACSLKSLEEAAEDPVARATAARARSFQPMRVMRREDKIRRRKQRKRQWLMKM